MEIEKQVSSLELSKKLKELGVKQESLWCWHLYHGVNGDVPQLYGDTHYRGEELSYCCPAFTVAELGEMLPDYFKSKEGDTQLRIAKFGSMWDVDYFIGFDTPYGKRANTEADARAKMLIYLIENNLMKVGE